MKRKNETKGTVDQLAGVATHRMLTVEVRILSVLLMVSPTNRLILTIDNDKELDRAINEIDELLKKRDLSTQDSYRLRRLSDAVYEYEERTDILNR